MKTVFVFLISAASAVLMISIYDKSLMLFGNFVLDDADIIADSLMSQIFDVAIFLYVLLFALLPGYFASKYVKWFYASLMVSIVPTLALGLYLYSSNVKWVHVAEMCTFCVLLPLLVSTSTGLSAVHNKSFKRSR